MFFIVSLCVFISYTWMQKCVQRGVKMFPDMVIGHIFYNLSTKIV